jgi:hypothetical protein
MPGVLQQLCIAVRICSTINEDGKHSLKLSLSDLDGKILGPPAEAPFETKTRDNERYTWTSAVIQIRDIRICEPNDYLLNLQIDGTSIANTTIFVKDGSKRKPM